MKVVRRAIPGIPARESADQIFDVRPARFAPHPTEHSFIDVLQRHVDVARDLVALRDGLDQLTAPMRRMRVKQADPKIAVDRSGSRAATPASVGPRDRINRLARAGLRLPQIHSVIGRVLADQIDLLHAFRHERANFRENRIRLPAAMPAAHLWNDAKAAGMIAALRDFQINAVRRGQSEPRRIVIRNVSRPIGDEAVAESAGSTGLSDTTRLTHDRPHLTHLIQADECIDLRKRLAKLRRKTLRHAAAYDQLLTRLFSQSPLLMRIENRIDRFFLCRIDEGAGIDHKHIGFLGNGGDFHSVLAQRFRA